MHIDWTSSTPWSSLTDGVLIGIATAMFALLNGRIASLVFGRGLIDHAYPADHQTV